MLNMGHDIVSMLSKSSYSSTLKNDYLDGYDASSINQLTDVLLHNQSEAVRLLSMNDLEQLY